MKIPAGHIFHGPDGQGYRLTRDVQTGDDIMAKDFEPFGGAPKPESHTSMPRWLQHELAVLYEQMHAVKS